MKMSHEGVYRSLATLLNAGLDLKQALGSSVAKEKGALHDAVIAAAHAVERGATLTRALARQPAAFPPSDRARIAS